ncbi:MAG: hypothetical protein ACI959_000132 [Limisphaerales bacterium]
MNRIYLLSLIICVSALVQAQSFTAATAPLPERLQKVPVAITVAHFPETVHAIETEPGQYYWKHNTSVLCEGSKIRIVEFGSFLFYDDKWNMRVAFEPKDMDRMFSTQKGVMSQAEPYTFVKNWRGGEMVFGGWAMWYFIGINATGERVCGYSKLETTDVLIHSAQ